MYAVVKTGGKQYRVAPGQVIQVEKIDAEVNSTIDLKDILMVTNGDNITVGAPYVQGAKVTATVLEQARHKKIKIVKFNRRKHHEKTTGHRQYYTALRITEITG
jgi:large subunit ribosomal protein L21